MREIVNQIEDIEKEMSRPDFWKNKEKAQKAIKELAELKEKEKNNDKYNKGGAVITFFAGAGGDDAEDWTRILFEMYSKFVNKKGWTTKIIHEHKTESGGYKNITFEIGENNAYGILKNESGVHRLVRVSPYSAKKLRHTSFALVEVVPKFVEPKEIEISDKDVKIEFSKSSGPGGQNVNKRETAVRILHIPTNISAHVDSERSQLQNKERALEILKSKLYKKKILEQREEKKSMKTSKAIEIEWGHQIRSYVLHPYKMVKDHRTGVETSDVQSVLEGGLDIFIKAEKNI